MEVELAKTAGFCFGVKRAVETVYQEIKKNEGARIYTYGPIIHNDEVIRDLKQQGVEVLNTLEELEGLTEGTVVIRSHGVPESVCSLLENKGIRYVETAPILRLREFADGPWVPWISSRMPGKRKTFFWKIRGRKYASYHRRHLITINFKN